MSIFYVHILFLFFYHYLLKDADSHVAISIFLYIEAYFAFYLMKQVFDI